MEQDPQFETVMTVALRNRAGNECTPGLAPDASGGARGEREVAQGEHLGRSCISLVSVTPNDRSYRDHFHGISMSSVEIS